MNFGMKNFILRFNFHEKQELRDNLHFHFYSGSYEDKTMGLYDNGYELNKHLVWTCVPWRYFLVFNIETRKGNIHRLAYSDRRFLSGSARTVRVLSLIQI